MCVRNRREIAYANSASDPSSSYAGRWAAKEAVVKAISSTAPNTPVTQGADGACRIHPPQQDLPRSVSRATLSNPHPFLRMSAAALIDIEILSSSSGAPVVEMHGYAAEVMRVVSTTRNPTTACVCDRC